MTTPHASTASAWRFRAQRTLIVATVFTLTTALAGCSSSADQTPTSVASTDDAAASAPSADDADPAQEPESGTYGPDDVGTATLYVNGVEFPDFEGDCEISRQNGKEDVGDLNDGDIVTIIGIDNVKAHEDSAINYVALNEERFTLRDPLGAAGVGGPSAKGEITTLTELGPRTAEGSRDIVEVRFAGLLDDGTTVDADVVCELQNAF